MKGEFKSSVNESKGSFYYELNGAKKAESTISIAGTVKVIIDHTEVDTSLAGQGIGLELIRNIADYARKNELKVIPLCPFANAMFKRHDEFKDVW